MPVDYSRFDKLGDSDDSGDVGHPSTLDFADLLGGTREPNSGSVSPSESPRNVLAKERSKAGLEGNTLKEKEDIPLFERFIMLATGNDMPNRRDDAVMMLSAVKATVQSALASGAEAAPRQALQALTVGLSAQPQPVLFAKEQAPELVAELLELHASQSFPGMDCERVLQLLAEQCRAREIYTFLLEAFGMEDLSWPARKRGIGLLMVVLLKMEVTKRDMFLGPCFSLLLKTFVLARTKPEESSAKLEALRIFATTFLPPVSEEEAAHATGDPSQRVVRSMVSGFLFKVVQKALPSASVVQELFLDVTSSAMATENVGSKPSSIKKVRLRYADTPGCCSPLPALGALAQQAASCLDQPLLTLLESLDVADPTGDGGGDLECSPLSLAAYVCLLQMCDCWRYMAPQVLPVGLSSARRANILMRTCVVLVSNRDVASDCLTSGESGFQDDAGNKMEGRAVGASGGCWAHRGFELFCTVVAPSLQHAARQVPQAFASLSGPLCSWYPARSYRTLLEAVATTPDIDREVRGQLFRDVAAAMRLFAWPCRFEMYLDIVQKCRIDSVIGAVITLLKDDWWARVRCAEGLAALGEERKRLTKVLRATLSGDVQVVEGMDTLTAALNLSRLVALASSPVGPFMREGLRKGGTGVNLDEMLCGISKQLDIEMGILNTSPDSDRSTQSALVKELEQALGKAEGGIDLVRMKEDRLNMVAHLVARVRELLARGHG